MVKIKINIKVLKRDELLDSEPIMVTEDEKFVVTTEIDENDEVCDFDILCYPLLGGIAIHGIQNNTARMNEKVDGIEIHTREHKLISDNTLVVFP